MNIKVFKAIIALLTVVILILGGLLMAQKTEMTKKMEPLPDIDTSVSAQQLKATAKAFSTTG